MKVLAQTKPDILISKTGFYKFGTFFSHLDYKHV